MRDDRKLLDGEFSVYPGHPVVLAYLITQAYPSFAEASKPTEHNWCHALGSNDIPGAGGNVAAAMRLLHTIVVQGLPFSDAIIEGERYWACCDGQAVGNPERFEEGRLQASRIEQRLKDVLETWR